MEFDIGYFDALVKQSAGLRQFRNRLLAWELGRIFTMADVRPATADSAMMAVGSR